MDYTSQHKGNILSETATGFYNISSGSIIRFSYKGKTVSNPRPLVLVLNPDYENKLHGIALDTLSESMLNDLADIVRETLADKIERATRIRIKTNRIRIDGPASFYQTKIKPLLTRQKDNPYRTYDRSGITSVRTIDYRFKDSVKSA